jgi:glucose/arabinose dehydrogenase
MRRVLSVAVVLATLVPLAANQASAGASSPSAVGAQLVKGGLDWPAAFTFAPDGRIFYGERYTGEVRIYNPANGTDVLYFTVPNVVGSGEQGLLGIALDPNWPTTARVYVYATRMVSGQPKDQIVRITGANPPGGSMTVIFSSDTVSGSYHDGGRIRFGPDGKLYAIVGDAHNDANAQNLGNKAGKFHRMNTDGSAPTDNPIAGSTIWAYGIRNSFGFAFDPRTGFLWETENGPSCNDEVNLIRKGRNYGWGPNETCSTPPAPPLNTNQDGPNRQLPLTWFTPVIAPIGIGFCEGCGLTGGTGKAYFIAYNLRQIRQITFTTNRRNIASMTTVYTHSTTPLSMEVGVNDALYFSTPTGIYKMIQS